MAVIIPISYSIFYYQENISSVKILGIILALMAVVLTVIGKQGNKIERKYIYLPLIIFFGAGIVDSMIKFAQEKYLQEDLLPLFSAILFSMSGLIGLLIFILRKQKLKELISIKTLFWGSFLGVANFGTIFFFVNALNKSTIDSSAIFGINHIGIVTLSVLAALIIFKEKISLTKWIGITIAIFSIILLFNT
jgi:drug/metabolite transporter (DMT)-like permease